MSQRKTSPTFCYVHLQLTRSFCHIPDFRIDLALCEVKKSWFTTMQILLIFQTITFHQFLPSEIHFPAAIFVCLPMSLYQLVEPAIVVTMMMAALQ